MSEPAGLLLSVWGEARRMVPPGAVLAAREAVTVHEVAWHVDWDNPAWPGVRAAAVQAAIAKGRDYAAALGGSLRGVEPDAPSLDRFPRNWRLSSKPASPPTACP